MIPNINIIYIAKNMRPIRIPSLMDKFFRLLIDTAVIEKVMSVGSNGIPIVHIPKIRIPINAPMPAHNVCNHASVFFHVLIMANKLTARISRKYIPGARNSANIDSRLSRLNCANVVSTNMAFADPTIARKNSNARLMLAYFDFFPKQLRSAFKDTSPSTAKMAATRLSRVSKKLFIACIRSW